MTKKDQSIQVTTLRYTRRFNVAQYEHEEVTLDVVPHEGQSAADLLSQTRDFVESSRPKVNGAYISKAEVEAVETKKKATKPKALPSILVKAAKTEPTADEVSRLFADVQAAKNTHPDLLASVGNELADRIRALRSRLPAERQAELKPSIDLLVEYKKRLESVTT